MNEYSEHSTQDRMETYGAGGIAADQFEAHCVARGIQFKRFGIEHTPDDQLTYGPYDRYRPDYLVGDKLVEVMSLSPGGDGGRLRIKPTLRIKVQKLEGLRWWNDDMSTCLWVFDTNERQGGYVWLDTISMLIFEGRFGVGEFRDEWEVRPFFRFNRDDLAVEWFPAEKWVPSTWKRSRA